MKQSSSSKPISSPGRALVEKFPPPLMRFLRSKSTRAKPKSKTKASPLFFRKKKPSGAGETQEPSSPKVTCIGQVRVRRSKNSRSRRRRPENPTKTRFAGKCLCPARLKLKSFWGKCVSWFCCRTGDSSKCGSNRVKEEEEVESIRTSRTEEREIRVECEFAASEVTPPKNAFLLTRCRSAPYRSSSLACRLWGTEEVEDEERENIAQKTEEETTVSVPVASGIEAGRDSAASEIPLANGGEKKLEEEREKEAPGIMAAMMKRCRSEPARRGRERETLDPLTSEFWRERRLSNTDSCSKPRAPLC